MGGKITALEIQKKNQERVNVYIENEFAFGLNLVDAARLQKGQMLSDTEIAALKARDHTAQAFDKAVRFLAPRPRSAAEVRRRLQQKDVDESVIDEVIERLEALNYINDLEFAQYWLRNREAFNPRGKAALRYELQQKGIDSSIIDQLLTDFDAEDAAYRAAAKKMRSLRGRDDETIRHKLSSFLSRRGFGYDTIRAVVNQIVDEREAENEE